MRAEFSEREYETVFNREISTKCQFIWTPGQHQEHWLGFDGAYVSDDPRLALLDLWPHMLPGTRLLPEYWEEWISNVDRLLPPFRFNLFVQHKRPEYIASPRGKERSHWRCRYYRFDIDQHQQRRLVELEVKTTDHALVTYACAAFHRSSDLWDCTQRRSLVTSSNYVSPSLLSGHERYSFKKGGNNGAVHSDTEAVEDVPIVDRLDLQVPSDRVSIRDLIQLAAATAGEIMESDELAGDLFRRIVEVSTRFQSDLSPVQRSIVVARVFCVLNATSWTIVCRQNTPQGR